MELDMASFERQAWNIGALMHLRTYLASALVTGTSSDHKHPQ
jgi:hypothetical protein